jgi:hypothetical protein
MVFLAERPKPSLRLKLRGIFSFIRSVKPAPTDSHHANDRDGKSAALMTESLLINQTRRIISTTCTGGTPL